MGRANQRYGDGGERLVAGCIPYRNVPGGVGAGSWEVLVVTSSSGKGWVFPKGGWELDEAVPSEAARREVLEEAGVQVRRHPSS